MNTFDSGPPMNGCSDQGMRHAGRFQRALLCGLIALNLASCGDSGKPGEATATETSPASPVVAAPVETAQSALASANAAFRANRIVAPAGDNALEHALTAIRLDPRNAGANEIIVDITPIAASAIEVAIKSGDLVEARRVMALLASASPDSLIVQNLQRRLETASRVPVPVAATVVSNAPATAVPPLATARPDPAPAPSVAEAAPAESEEITSSTLPVNRQAPASTSPPTLAPTESPAPARAPAVPAPVAATAARADGVSSDPVPLVKFAPEYPAAAKKRRAEGWVELQFIVGTNGVASQIEVVRAQPEGIFDRAAVRALSRWKFKPGERDGEVVESRARTTISFKLG